MRNNDKSSASTVSNIKIDLDASDSSRRVDSSELVQRSAYDKLLNEIRIDLTKSTSFLKKTFPIGSGLVYFIDGTRGAGKSTFLQSVFSALPIESNIRLQQLAYIDPSRIEIGEVVLLPILKALQEAANRALRRNGRLGTESATEEFRKKLKNLAGGLSLFAKQTSSLGDIDPELFLDWGLDRAASGSAFRDHLHDLIRTTCQLLDVDALVLAIDDADTNAVHAIKVLECIRMYLDTPNLVVLVTGDMELYSQLVRDHFYASLGERLHKFDEERTQQRIRMVDHLEDQYLLKLFPIRRRVQLRPLWNLLELDTFSQQQPYQFELSCALWSKRTPKSVIQEVIRRGLRINDSRDISLHYEFLLKQPLRSVLQILSRCASAINSSDELGDKDSSWNFELSELLSQSLRAMALGSLYKYNVDVDSISAHELPALIDAVFDLTLRNGDVDTGAYLRPQPSDPALKSCFSALSADVSLLCAEKPAALLRYIFAGPGSVSLYGHAYQQNSERISPDRLRAQFKEYLGIGRKEDALNWAWHATAVLSPVYVPIPPRAVVDFGIIGLNKRKPQRAPKDSNHFTIKNAVAAGIASTGQIPVFAFSLVDVSGRGSRTYASIFNILGLIDRLLSLDPKSGTRLKADVARVLAKVLKTPTISRPGWEGALSVAPDDDDEDQEFDPENIADLERSGLEQIISDVVDWLRATADLRKEVRPSAILAGKIWTRLYFSLEKAAEHGRGQVSAATLMERFALCAINALLVEEWDHHLLAGASQQRLRIGTIDRTNPQSSPAIVANKFRHEYVNQANLPLTFLIASSPLILGLLRRDDRYRSMLDRLLPNMSDDRKFNRLSDDEHWAFLEQAYIAGWKY